MKTILITQRGRMHCLALVLTATIAPTLSAQNFSIDWFKIAGGGATAPSTGGVYAVSGTIGQPDAGTMSGGAFTVNGGFWGIITAVQTPGAPLLSLVSVPGGVRVSWPSPSAGFVLQRSDSLTTTNWTSLGEIPADDGTNRSVIVSPAGNAFFRLKK